MQSSDMLRRKKKKWSLNTQLPGSSCARTFFLPPSTVGRNIEDERRNGYGGAGYAKAFLFQGFLLLPYESLRSVPLTFRGLAVWAFIQTRWLDWHRWLVWEA